MVLVASAYASSSAIPVEKRGTFHVDVPTTAQAAIRLHEIREKNGRVNLRQLKKRNRVSPREECGKSARGEVRANSSRAKVPKGGEAAKFCMYGRSQRNVR